MPGVAPITNGESDEDHEGDEDNDDSSDEEIAAINRLGRTHRSHAMKLSQERIMVKCACLWRTIILSSLSKTLFPSSQ